MPAVRNLLLAILFVATSPSIAGAPTGGLPGVGVFSYHGSPPSPNMVQMTIAVR